MESHPGHRGVSVRFWLFSQIADTRFVERLCSQAAVLTVGAGAFRVWMLESVKAKQSS